MLGKSLLFFLSISLFYMVNAESCAGTELGPAENFQIFDDKLLYMIWNPPTGFENCEVDYKLHIQNLNTSEYLIPIQNLTCPSFVFDYAKNDNICIHSLITLYSHYADQTSRTILGPFIDPPIPMGPMADLEVINTDENFLLLWSTPLGYEKCADHFLFRIYGKFVATGEIQPFTQYHRWYNLTYSYTNSDDRYCMEMDIVVSGFHFGKESEVSKIFVFGPPSLCNKKD